MSHDEDSDAFDDLFAEITADGTATKTAEVSDEPEVVAPLADSRENLIENLVAEPVVREVAKPDEKKVVYKTVDKVEIEGGPNGTSSKVYPLGYLALTFLGWRFQNKACLYLDALKSFVAFCRSPECDAWMARLEAAGCRNRGEARKEG
jgi:hypothetical protein